MKFGKPKRPLNAKARFGLDFWANYPDDVKSMKNAWQTGKEAWEGLSEEEKLVRYSSIHGIMGAGVDIRRPNCKYATLL